MLCIIDMQNDFVDEQKGKMAVKGTDKLINGIVIKYMSMIEMEILSSIP
ncbi:hypothetical protein [Desulfopila inferna]|nr:hypothetical protein [Desulfopila inferna]MBM9602886.1 hypothetical protein [Desulfopila inferna]